MNLEFDMDYIEENTKPKGETMKAILKFELPDEDTEHKCAVYGLDIGLALSEILSTIKTQIKYNENLTEEAITALEELRDKTIEDLDYRGISFVSNL